MTKACKGCCEPVINGDLRYNGREPEESWHAHCWTDRPDRPAHTNMSDLRAQMASNLSNMEDALNRLKRDLAKKGIK